MDKGSLQEGPGGFPRQPWEAKGGQRSAGPSYILLGLFPAKMDGKHYTIDWYIETLTHEYIDAYPH
jgi:hypothetical protein